MHRFGGLDRCAICKEEMEEHGERMVSLEGFTYVFCTRCSKNRRKEIEELLKLKDE